MKKPVFNNTARLVILNEIFEEFQQMTQWDIRNADSTAEHLHKAERLIELLEVDDCGSIGGFDRDNPVQKLSNFEQYDRFLALIMKRHLYKDIEPVCGFSVGNLIDIFNCFGSVRDGYEPAR